VDAAASGAADLLLLSGKPLQEPVARYGPFVMNTPEQIEHAFRDYQSGRFGVIPQR
jgi:redox-sensitive bicupin YhaK (pirin superfamily)